MYELTAENALDYLRSAGRLSGRASAGLAADIADRLAGKEPPA